MFKNNNLELFIFGFFVFLGIFGAACSVFALATGGEWWNSIVALCNLSGAGVFLFFYIQEYKDIS